MVYVKKIYGVIWRIHMCNYINVGAEQSVASQLPIFSASWILFWAVPPYLTRFLFNGWMITNEVTPKRVSNPCFTKKDLSIVTDIQQQETSHAQLCDSCPRRSSNHSMFPKPSSCFELFTPVGIKTLQLTYSSSVKICFSNRFLRTHYILFTQQNKQIYLAF